MDQSEIITVVSSVLIPLIIGTVTFLIAKKQIINTGITQFRQRWIDELRNSISIYISKAEMIAMLEYDEEELYFEYFEELSQMHSKIELMLNPNEAEHNSLLGCISKIRDLIHKEGIKVEKLEKNLDKAIGQLLIISKTVLKKEWEVVKGGK
jgi:hypothetical protein